MTRGPMNIFDPQPAPGTNHEPAAPPPQGNGSGASLDGSWSSVGTTQDSVSFTVVESRDLLTKTVVVDGDGKLGASGAISLTKGTARRVTLTGTATEIMSQLAGQLSRLSSHEALICAPPPAGRDEW